MRAIVIVQALEIRITLGYAEASRKEAINFWLIKNAIIGDI